MFILRNINETEMVPANQKNLYQINVSLFTAAFVTDTANRNSVTMKDHFQAPLLIQIIA